VKSKLIIALIVLTGCSTGHQYPLKYYQMKEYAENKRKHPNIYVLSVKQQFGENK
jgi:uncharacterized lipoprotein YmbA